MPVLQFQHSLLTSMSTRLACGTHKYMQANHPRIYNKNKIILKIKIINYVFHVWLNDTAVWIPRLSFTLCNWADKVTGMFTWIIPLCSHFFLHHIHRQYQRKTNIPCLLDSSQLAFWINFESRQWNGTIYIQGGSSNPVKLRQPGQLSKDLNRSWQLPLSSQEILGGNITTAYL